MRVALEELASLQRFVQNIQQCNKVYESLLGFSKILKKTGHLYLKAISYIRNRYSTIEETNFLKKILLEK